jgi:hypothetical protein
MNYNLFMKACCRPLYPCLRGGEVPLHRRLTPPAALGPGREGGKVETWKGGSVYSPVRAYVCTCIVECFTFSLFTLLRFKSYACTRVKGHLTFFPPLHSPGVTASRTKPSSIKASKR